MEGAIGGGRGGEGELRNATASTLRQIFERFQVGLKLIHGMMENYFLHTV
jgi:hypothetical protein